MFQTKIMQIYLRLKVWNKVRLDQYDDIFKLYQISLIQQDNIIITFLIQNAFRVLFMKRGKKVKPLWYFISDTLLIKLRKMVHIKSIWYNKDSSFDISIYIHQLIIDEIFVLPLLIRMAFGVGLFTKMSWCSLFLTIPFLCNNH